MPTAVIILAAGLGTRMRSDLPKVLHPLGAVPLLWHAMRAGAELAPERTVIVTGHGASAVTKVAHALDPDAEIVEQQKQCGTGDAVKQARATLRGFEGDAFVLYGDTPFIRPETLKRMQAARAAGNALVVLGFQAENPGRYGRLITEETGELLEIVEAGDARAGELAVRLCNSGVIAADAGLLMDLVGEIDNRNASGEYYLTDIAALVRARGHKAAVVNCDEAETMGVDSRAGLARAEALFQDRARSQALETGVTLRAPETVHFAFDTVIGRDVEIDANVVFGPGVTIESGACIRAFCHLEGCHVANGAIVGPYARLRPGAEISDAARIGNFVEIKNALIDEGAKVNHLSYVGDAEVGKGANIGAGTITCNYDGVMKHPTRIGAGAFIGSNTALVAPVSVGDDAITGSGSVITRDVPDGALALARAEQVTRKGLARRHMSRLRAQKKKRDEEG